MRWTVFFGKTEIFLIWLFLIVSCFSQSDQISRPEEHLSRLNCQRNVFIHLRKYKLWQRRIVLQGMVPLKGFVYAKYTGRLAQLRWGDNGKDFVKTKKYLRQWCHGGEQSFDSSGTCCGLEGKPVFHISFILKKRYPGKISFIVLNQRFVGKPVFSLLNILNQRCHHSMVLTWILGVAGECRV